MSNDASRTARLGEGRIAREVRREAGAMKAAAAEMACSDRTDGNLGKTHGLACQAVAAGANIVLLQEMFPARPFGMPGRNSGDAALASTIGGSIAVRQASALAAEPGIVGPPASSSVRTSPASTAWR